MGNKNNYNNANFVQVGYQHNNCGCDNNNNDVVAAAPYNTGCDCDKDNGYTTANTYGRDKDNGYTTANTYGHDKDNGYTTANTCGCDNGAVYTGNGCDNGSTYTNSGKWSRGRSRSSEKNCDCDNGNVDETHIFYETCDGAKEISITGRCQEDEALGRTLDVNCTLLNVCPGRRSALGLTLTEVDEDGTEYARGFRAITVPAHNNRCNQDVQVDTVRFILPEDLSLQDRRHFIVRSQHHYLDASNIWNNNWGGKH